MGGPLTVVVAALVTAAIAVAGAEEVLTDPPRDVSRTEPLRAAGGAGAQPCGHAPALSARSTGSHSMGDDVACASAAMSVLWSAFLMAAVLEMVVFALVDPESLRWFGGDALDLTPRAVYSLAFFLFWVVIAVGGALALLLCSRSDDINRARRTASARTR